jgi:hypothetical protein
MYFSLGCALAILGIVTVGQSAPMVATSQLFGTVVSDDSQSLPIRRVIVSVSGGQLKVNRSAITDDDGRFVIADLPPGIIRVTAAKHGYVFTPALPRQSSDLPPTVLKAGESTSVTLRMVRSSVLAGVVTDSVGQPVSGMMVFAINATRDPSFAFQDLLVSDGGRGGVVSDDRGSFRIFDLMPGDYYVAALVPWMQRGVIERPSLRENDSVLAQAALGNVSSSAAATVQRSHGAGFSIAPTYFPGTPILANAMALSVGPGAERNDIAFAVQDVPISSVEGQVIGNMYSDDLLQISILSGPVLRLPGLGSATPILSKSPRKDGQFRFDGVPPGHYTLVAKATRVPVVSAQGARGAVKNPIDTSYAVEEIDVFGADISSILQLRPAARFSGRVSIGHASSGQIDLSKVQIRVVPIDGLAFDLFRPTTIGERFSALAPATISADGTFRIDGIPPGKYRLECSLSNSTLFVGSAISRGQDLLDTGLTLLISEDRPDAQLWLTDRHTRITGALEVSQGGPLEAYDIVVFPAENKDWTSLRRLRRVRASQSGTFLFQDLPDGEYIIGVLQGGREANWQSPEFLTQIAKTGAKVRLTEGQREPFVNLRITGRF